jgi:hypothetical protein
MPAVSGSFSGNVKVQRAFAVSDQRNHELSVAEIHGTQKSTDEKWNNAAHLLGHNGRRGRQRQPERLLRQRSWCGWS